MSSEWIENLGESAFPFPCCDHCGCGTDGGYWPEREGHDDSCSLGCNGHNLTVALAALRSQVEEQ